MEPQPVPKPVAESRPEPLKPVEPIEKPRSVPKQARQKIPQWIVQVRKLDLLEVAEVVGLSVEDNQLRPCPSCGNEAGAEIYRNKSGWLLWRCGVCEIRDRGNLDLASYAIAGEKAGDLEPDRKALLRLWFADQGWCDIEEVGERAPRM